MEKGYFETGLGRRGYMDTKGCHLKVGSSVQSGKSMLWREREFGVRILALPFLSHVICEDKTMFSQRPRREFSRHRYPFPCPWCCSFNNCLLSTHHMLSHMLHAGGTEMSQKLCIPSGISQSSEGDRHKEQITKNMGHAIVQSYATGIELRGITYSG